MEFINMTGDLNSLYYYLISISSPKVNLFNVIGLRYVSFILRIPNLFSYNKTTESCL